MSYKMVEESIKLECKKNGWKYDDGMLDLVLYSMDEENLSAKEAIKEWVKETKANGHFGIN